MTRVHVALALLLGAGCGSPGPGGGDPDLASPEADLAWAADLAMPDAAAPPDLAPSPRRLLLDALGRTVWSGVQTRGGKDRVYELRFDAPSLFWAEIQNPFGPARRRELRVFSVDDDGRTVHTTVVSPIAWPDARDIGRKDTFTLEIVDNPRALLVTRNGVTEEYFEGPWDPPTDGLTATVRVFQSGGVVDGAFCTSGNNGFDYPTILSFARGASPEPILGSDVAAGAWLLTWHDGTMQNRFAVTDVDGFEYDDRGGTELSSQANFFVTYRGTISHPGGALTMRELDDSVEDGVWVFLGGAAGVGNVDDLFLEVHGFFWADATSDVPSVTLPAGDIPVEIIVARCAKQIRDVDVEIRLGGQPFDLVGFAPTLPLVDDTLFPPAF